MAQVTPKLSWFEQSWRPRLNLAAKLLRGFHDRWLLSGDPFPTREVVAVLLNVFAFDFYKADFLGHESIQSDQLWKRSLDEWLGSVGTPESECRQLCPSRSEFEYGEMVELLCVGVLRAAASWEGNGSMAIGCVELVQWMVDQLVARRLVAIRYG